MIYKSKISEENYKAVTKELYYTPEDEEFHIGFEYEYKYPENQWWNPAKIETFDDLRTNL